MVEYYYKNIILTDGLYQSSLGGCFNPWDRRWLSWTEYMVHVLDILQKIVLSIQFEVDPCNTKLWNILTMYAMDFQFNAKCKYI